VSCLHTTESSFPNPESAFPASAWYAIQTVPRHEKKVAAELTTKDITAFLPLASSQRQWSDRRVVVDMPLFPGYVFVRIPQEPSTRIAVLRTQGVRNFVGTRGHGDPIPDSQIESIQAVLARGVPFDPYPYLSVGQRVRICDGSLEGIEGVLTAIHGDQSLVISVELIQRSLAIRLTGFRIQPA
jgi:transcription antitermination factor NusG